MPRYSKIIAGLILFAGISGGVYYFMSHKNQKTTEDLYTTENVKLKNVKDLFTPSYIPDGYEIDQNAVASPENTEDVVIVQLISETQPRIFISQQPLPNDFNEDKFLANMKNKNPFDTDVGRAFIGTINDGSTLMVSVANEKLWIIINSEKSVPRDTLIKIAKGLKH